MKPVLIISALLFPFLTPAQTGEESFYRIFSCSNGMENYAMKCSGGHSTVYTTGIITSITYNPTFINITAFPWDTVRINGSWDKSQCHGVLYGIYNKNGTAVYTSRQNPSYYDVTESGTYSYQLDRFPPNTTFNVTFIYPTGIAEDEDAEIRISPVPVRDVMAITCSYNKYDLTITDLSGKTICNFRSESDAEKFDISFLKSGIYIARFTDQGTGM